MSIKLYVALMVLTFRDAQYLYEKLFDKNPKMV